VNQISKTIMSSVFVVCALTACGGGGGDSTNSSSILTPPLMAVPAPAGFTNIAGKVTFDHVPLVVNTSGQPRLEFTSTTRRAVRAVAVEIVDSASQTILTKTSTNASGDYVAQVPAGRSVFVRANAELWIDGVSTPNVIEVLDNTQNDAQYVLDSTVFSTSTSLLTQNLHAASGWSGAAYTGVRAAAPFAILDTIYNGVLKVRSVDGSAAFPKLSVHWSVNNTSAGGDNTALGQIGTSYFASQTSGGVAQRDLYILGKANNDTDEFDAHVITHEFGHYLQSAFSRDDSVGGGHGPGNILDMRVAFSEGWGNAWSGIALNNKIYADSLVAGAVQGSVHDVSLGDSTNPGWFSEHSVEKIFWDISASPSMGFAPVWSTMRNGMTQSSALTSAHSFAFHLAQRNPSLVAPLSTILSSQKITLPKDAYGAGETNFATPAIANLNPIYMSYTGIGSTLTGVCLSDEVDLSGDGNKAGEYRYVRMTLPAGLRTITVTRTAATTTATDPEFALYGKVAKVGQGIRTFANTETSQINVTGGDYVLVVSDFNFRTNQTTSRPCFNVLVN
jgi:hypothetical protein